MEEGVADVVNEAISSHVSFVCLMCIVHMHMRVPGHSAERCGQHTYLTPTSRTHVARVPHAHLLDALHAGCFSDLCFVCACCAFTSLPNT